MADGMASFLPCKRHAVVISKIMGNHPAGAPDCSEIDSDSILSRLVLIGVFCGWENHIFTCINIYIYVKIHIYTYSYLYIYTHTTTKINTRININVNIDIHIHIYLPVSLPIEP